MSTLYNFKVGKWRNIFRLCCLIKLFEQKTLAIV